jgi:pentatricopeptide repeat protein
MISISNINTINTNTNNTKTTDSQVMIPSSSLLYDSASRFSGSSSSRRHWSSSAFFSTTSPPPTDDDNDDDDDEGERKGTRVKRRNETLSSSLSSTSTSSTSTARENTSSSSSSNSMFTHDYDQLAIDRMVLGGGGGIDDFVYQSIDVDSVVTEDHLQRLFDDHISHTCTSNNSNYDKYIRPNSKPIAEEALPNPNMLLNMLEMLRNEEANISNDTILRIFRQVVQSKRVKLLERAEDVVVKNKYDPQLLRLLIAGYVNANAAERACTLLMDWPNESIQHQPGIKSYRLVLTALSSSSSSNNDDDSNNRNINNNKEKRLQQKKNQNRNNDPNNNNNNNNNNQEQQDRQYEENNNTNKYRLAHRLLLHMCRNHIKFPQLSLTPDRDLFHRVLGACTSIESLSTAEQVLDDMMRFANGEEVVDTTTTPTTMADDNIIYNSGNDIIRIPAPIDTYPTISTIRLLVKGWTTRIKSNNNANNNNKNYEERNKKTIKMQQEVFEFLRRMEEKEALSPLRQQHNDSSSSSSSSSSIVDIDCYNVILNIIAELGQYELAENIFYRLLTDYLKDKSNIQPDAVTLNTVLKSHVKANTEVAAFAAERFLQRLDDFHDQQEKIQNKARYCFIENDDEDGSSSSSSSNNHNIIAEDDHTEDKEDYSNSDMNRSVKDDALINKNSHSNNKTPRLVDHIQPTARARTTILNLWIKLGQPNKAIDILTKAESIYQKKELWLQHEQQHNNDHQNGTNNNIKRFKPDKISYHQIIGGLSKLQASSPTVDLAAQAEEIAERMSITGHSVNIRTCNTILNCWTKSGNPDRAESFMEETMSHYVAPDIVSYNTIINGYARLGNLNRSLELLTRLLDGSLISNTNNNSLLLPKPNSRTFTSILTALSREKTAKAAEEAETLLLQMQELYDSPYNLDTRPNIITYNAVMNCWASLSFPSRQRQRSHQQRVEQDDRNDRNNANSNNDCHHYGSKAESVLRSIQGLDDKDDRPNVISYNTVIRAYSNDMDKTEELLQDMIKNGLHPNEHTYDTVYHVLRRDKRVKNKEQKFAEICEQYFPSSSSSFSSIMRNKNNKDRSDNNNRNNKNIQGNNKNNKNKKRQHQ